MSDYTAILADVHANANALRAVLARADEMGCSRIFCLGDMVGYGARPNECLDLLRDRDAQCLMGNHEALVLSTAVSFNYNQMAIAAGDFTREVLRQDNFDFLNSLSEQIELPNGALLVHGAPRERDQYLLNDVDFELALRDLVEDRHRLCFFGHTHRVVFFDGESSGVKDGQEKKIDADRATVINPGSVGQPRDGNPAAAFLCWDPEGNRVLFERVEYDTEKTRREIIEAGLPARLGDRLLAGR